VSTAFLVSSLVFLALTLNALRPIPLAPLAIPSFFASWLTAELAPHHLVGNLALTAFFVAAGALRGAAGWTALAANGLTVAGLAWLVRSAMRVREVTEAALVEGLGPGYREAILPHRAPAHDLRSPWRQLLLPFRMRHPDVERIRDITYGPAGRRNLLDVYRRRDRPEGCPVLLQIHGGAWTVSNKNQQGKPIMLHFAARGWLCVAPNYRLSPRAAWPAHLEDVKRAIAWIRTEGPRYGADPRFIVVTGGSAGGHLAAMAALTAGDPSLQPGFEEVDTTVQAAVPHYGVYDLADDRTLRGRALIRMLERWVIQRRFREDRKAFEAASPLYRVHADAPPFFVVHGTADLLAPVEAARAFVARLRQVSRQPVVYAELPGAQHAFDVFPSIRAAHVIRAVERFADVCYSAWLREREGLPAGDGARDRRDAATGAPRAGRRAPSPRGPRSRASRPAPGAGAS
jgi:acetyl esterase/lipase